MMRYYEFVLNANAEKIKENSKINLKEYDYQSPIAAMNNYMYRNMKNGICYFAYREEGETTRAAFCYAEKKDSFREAYDYIFEILYNIFCIKMKVEPQEITMYQFFECSLECRRRNYAYGSGRIIEAANIEIYNDYNNDKALLHYDLKEKIISENNKKKI